MVSVCLLSPTTISAASSKSLLSVYAMVLKYKEYTRLRRGLDGGVSAVTFSSKGTYVAAAGALDCTVYLWRVVDRKLVKTFKASSPSLCLLWLPDQEDELMCGNQSGCIDHIQLLPVRSCPIFYALLIMRIRTHSAW